MQIYANSMAWSVYQNYTLNVASLRRSMRKLSSGLRIQHAGDDPAGLAMSERLRTQYRNSAAAAANVENKVNYLQTADSWLQKMHDMMGRMSELAVSANDGTKSAQDRENLQREFEQMQHEIQRITSGATAAAKFNGLYLFRGGTGEPSASGDLVVGFPTRTRGYVRNVSHDGSGVTSASWQATYDDNVEQWTIENLTTGTVEATLNLAPDQGGSVTLEGSHGFVFSFDAPAKGTFGMGDTFTWTNTAYTAPIPGSPTFANVAVQAGGATTSMRGTGSGVTTADWTATYDAVTRLWTVRNETTGTDVGTISANPEQGGSINLEGANGFRLVLGAPTRGSYATGDQYAWSNTAYVPAMMNIPALNNSTTPTSGAAQVTMAGDGSGLTTANWSATYDGLNRRWTIRNETTASDVGTINAAPNAGGSLMNIEGANGFSVTIQAPGAGTEYNDGDRFTWTNQGFVAAQAGAGLLSPTTGYTAGSSSLAAAGDGSGVSAATWRATYDAVAQQWTVRNVTTATDVATIAALPNGGGFADLEGANGYRFTVNAPTSGQYTTGDYFQWTNTAGSVAGAASFTDNTTSVSGSMTNVTQGDGSGVSTANWSATYNAVTQQWSVRNETTSTQVGTISAAPNSGGSLALEGANGSLLTISAPTVSQYKSGDRFTWNNSAQIVQAVGSTTFHDDPGTTVGTASATRDGDSTSVTSAWWRATYNDLIGAWTISNETTGQTVGSIGAAPNAGVSYVNIEGLNGHTITINAPTSGLYNTGDYFRWRTTAHVPPVLPSPSFISAGAPAAGASVTYVGDGYDVTNANWHAQYDAVAQQWTVTNRTTGQVVGTINAAPNAGGSLADIEGTDGFDFVINAPSGTSYSTGDEFTWTNQVHDPAIPGIADYTDANTLKVSLQVGPDSNQVFTEQEIVLEADYFKVIGSYVSYRYGSVNMTLLASFAHAVTWASLICPENVRIENQADAQGAVDKLNIGIDHLSSIRATLGAEMNRMEQTLSGLRNYEENVRATESRIRDVDIARETTEFARFQIMTQLSTALLAQANTLAGGVVQLLQ